MTKKLSILLFTLFLLRPFHSFSLNSFELSLVGIGMGVVFNQYFDRSLDNKSDLHSKVKILNLYQNSMKQGIRDESFFSLPMQQQLKVVEDLHEFNRY